jgi:hypothetical protein
MGDLSLHGITSIEMEKRSYDGKYGVVKLMIHGKSMDGPSYFTVSLFGDEGLSIEMDTMQPSLPDNIIDIVEEVNAA